MESYIHHQFYQKFRKINFLLVNQTVNWFHQINFTCGRISRFFSHNVYVLYTHFQKHFTYVALYVRSFSYCCHQFHGKIVKVKSIEDFIFINNLLLSSFFTKQLFWQSAFILLPLRHLTKSCHYHRCGISVSKPSHIYFSGFDTQV